MTAFPGQTGRTELAFAAIQAVTSIFVAADSRDWAVLRSRLADRIRLDWTSLSGGEPAELTGAEVTEAWRTLLSAFDATHHQLGNFLVDEIDAQQARLRFYGTATHVLAVPGQEGRWVLGARYHAALRHADDGWRATELTLTAVWGEGNQNLLAIAAARAGAGQ
ncbi:MAG: nuclear transport factor 2 family protein [Actinobacteria bacterium]|nr:nuclear transport factor 2 family protein [Actinomycetota bacterium]